MKTHDLRLTPELLDEILDFAWSGAARRIAERERLKALTTMTRAETAVSDAAETSATVGCGDARATC